VQQSGVVWKIGTSPGIHAHIADISRYSHHVTSVTAGWPIVKGVLSK
jgi:hypothetical protein